MAGTAGTQEHRDRPGGSSPGTAAGPRGDRPPESGYVLGAAAAGWASRHLRYDRHSRPSSRTVPTPMRPRLLTSNRAMEWMIFSLDYGTFIRVRRLGSGAVPGSTPDPPASAEPPDQQ